MRRVVHCVAVLSMLALAGGPTAALEPALAPATQPDTTSAAAAPFTPWPGADVAILGEQDAIGRGQECPTNSGSYCSDQYPVCCRSGDGYRCQASPSDCGR